MFLFSRESLESKGAESWGSGTMALAPFFLSLSFVNAKGFNNNRRDLMV